LVGSLASGPVQFDACTAKSIDKGYRSPEIVALRAHLRTTLALGRGETVVDAGCGTGLLCAEMANEVGSSGRVIGVDTSPHMLALAKSRCAAHPEIELHHGDIHILPVDDAVADALACMQVLLFVTDAAPTLLEFHRVLTPTGRLVIVETDWRSAVLNTSDKDLTHRLFEFWDTVSASPNLPARLSPLLRDAGFDVKAIEVVPILNTAFTSDSFSHDYVKGLAHQAAAAGVLSDTEASHWIADLEQKERDGGYFFCVNRFVFTAVKT
tara:strand:+ start:359 stop:1159 length:801 start_codon:yes stop_codon:yes gene_type:complete